MRSDFLTGLGRPFTSYSLQQTGKIVDIKNRLNVGQLVKGKVIDSLTNDRFIFRLRGLNLIALSSLSLKPGMTVFAHVVQLYPKLVLKWSKGRDAKDRLKDGMRTIGIDWNLMNSRIAERMLDSDMVLTLRSFKEMVGEVERKLDGVPSAKKLNEILEELSESYEEKKAPRLKTVKQKQLAALERQFSDNLRILSSNLYHSGLKAVENIDFIKEFVSDYQKALVAEDADLIVDLTRRMGLNYESAIAQFALSGDIQKAAVRTRLKGALLEFRSRLVIILSEGRYNHVLNKLLTATDNILEVMDKLRLATDEDGMRLMGFFHRGNDHRNEVIRWFGGKNEAGDRDSWRIRIEITLEPLGRTEAEIVLKNNRADVTIRAGKNGDGSTSIGEIQLLRDRIEELGYIAGDVKLRQRK